MCVDKNLKPSNPSMYTQTCLKHACMSDLCMHGNRCAHKHLTSYALCMHACMHAQAGFKKQLRDVLHDVEQEERASKDLKRRYDEAVGRCVGSGMLTG